MVLCGEGNNLKPYTMYGSRPAGSLQAAINIKFINKN